MKKKAKTPLRPNRSRPVRASNENPEPEPVSVPSPGVLPNSQTVPELGSQIRHLSMSQHSHNLLWFLKEDRARRKFCDVSVSVGGKLYSAHKVVLAHGSSYFHAELSKNPATTHVILDHVEDSVFQHLLGFLYTSECAVAERDLPAVTEAARFLDMMDILKLLCEKGDSHTVKVVQDDVGGSAEVGVTSSDLAAAETDAKGPRDVKSTVDSEQIRTEDSLCHTDLRGEIPTEKERVEDQKSITTRRSARRRKKPTKYQRENIECVINSTEEQIMNLPPREQDEEGLEEAGLDVEIQRDVDEEEEVEGVDINEEVAAEKKDVCAADMCVGQQSSDVQSTEVIEEQPIQEDGVNTSAAGGSTQRPTYPADLAPVIIQMSNKKTLKCPKCDKIFDRAGEIHCV